MLYFEAPNIVPVPLTFMPVFLAGGITNCRDWQKELTEKLAHNDRLALINPRRSNYNVMDPAVEKEQITWEYRYLRMCPYISFWFSNETVQPITLFELGSYLKDHNKTLFIGADPEYPRVRDIQIQLSLARPDLLPVHSLDSLAAQIQSKYDEGIEQDNRISTKSGVPPEEFYAGQYWRL